MKNAPIWGHFSLWLFLLFEGLVLSGNWVVLLELEFVSMLLLVLSGVVDVTFSNALFVAN